jgi:hypothetical protein
MAFVSDSTRQIRSVGYHDLFRVVTATLRKNAGVRQRGLNPPRGIDRDSSVGHISATTGSSISAGTRGPTIASLAVNSF